MEQDFEFRGIKGDSEAGRAPTMAEILRPKVQRDKPDISHLEDAVKVDEEGHPSLDLQVGDRIVIERYSGILKERPWLDTKPYYLNDVDQVTGKLKLYFEELQQHATDNFIAGMKLGNVYKKMPSNGRWDAPPRVVRKPEPRPISIDNGTVDQSTEKKGRGRPKGSKNRSKDVIEAEKSERSSARLAKRAARLLMRSNKK